MLRCVNLTLCKFNRQPIEHCWDTILTATRQFKKCFLFLIGCSTHMKCRDNIVKQNVDALVSMLTVEFGISTKNTLIHADAVLHFNLVKV